MKDEIKEILDDLRKTADNTVFVVCSSQEELDNIPKYTANFMSINDRKAKLLYDYITNLQEENQILKDIRNQAIDYNKVLCKIYDCGIELSNAETNLCILKDEETINTLQGKSDE